MTVPDPSSLPPVTIRLDGNGVPVSFLQLGREPDDARKAAESLLAFTADVSALARAIGPAVKDRTDARAIQVDQVGKTFHALAQKFLGLFDGLQLLVDYHLIFRMVAGLETSGIVGYREFGLQRACRDLQHPPRSAQNGHGGYPGLTHSQLLAVAYGLAHPASCQTRPVYPGSSRLGGSFGQSGTSKGKRRRAVALAGRGSKS
jgi:hypothetical protein